MLLCDFSSLIPTEDFHGGWLLGFDQILPLRPTVAAHMMCMTLSASRFSVDYRHLLLDVQLLFLSGINPTWL